MDLVSVVDTDWRVRVSPSLFSVDLVQLRFIKKKNTDKGDEWDDNGDWRRAELRQKGKRVNDNVIFAIKTVHTCRKLTWRSVF